jgi:hypothetical protein
VVDDGDIVPMSTDEAQEASDLPVELDLMIRADLLQAHDVLLGRLHAELL